jgi:hypothetical protein
MGFPGDFRLCRHRTRIGTAPHFVVSAIACFRQLTDQTARILLARVTLWTRTFNRRQTAAVFLPKLADGCWLYA